MTSYTLKATLASHSRPRVSNDNPYSESLFRTVKYCPSWPSEGFASIEASLRLRGLAKPMFLGLRLVIDEGVWCE
ncbi:hypothetical protein [Nitrincola tibetensis]|uniref:hypothetical protein n=1 Tax=Nitrincola tibetensis TaxID=2219697 RepID=UPI001057D16D|nr:hypothetical protein [Nitrincola tibetensis]